MKLIIAVIHLLLLSISVSCGQQRPDIAHGPEGYVCYSTTPLTIDGKLDEESWKNAPWTNDFVDIEGDTQPKPQHRTRAKMLWDDDYFYIAAEMIEPHIWGTYDKRDMVIFHENDFEVFIDPDGDTHNYYEFEINALGTYWDLMLIKPYLVGGPPINAWDIKGLKTGIDIRGTLNDPSDEDQLWTVEIAFPWEVLKEAAPEVRKPRDGEQWRVNFSRVNWRIEDQAGKYVKTINPETGESFPEYNWVWSPQGLINMHLPEMWGFVQFSSVKAGSGDAEFKSDPEDEVKWLLRNLYYAQKEYFDANNKYTTDISSLSLPEDISKKLSHKAKILITNSLFEITYPAIEAGYEWHIREDSKIWKTKQLK